MTLRSEYNKQTSERESYLERGRAAAELTLPYLMTREGHTSSSDLPTPYQSLGARGVNNLAAKMLQSMFPINQPVFRLVMDEATMEEVTGQEGMRAAVEEALARIERITTSTMEMRAYRPELFEALRHLIITGNVLLNIDPQDGKLVVYALPTYVTKRSRSGKLLSLILKEEVEFEELPEATQEAISAGGKYKEGKSLELFTGVKLLKDGKYSVMQEVAGIEVEGSDGTYPADKLPWIPVRFNRVSGEHYGRGYVEEYIGDLISSEGLSEAILEGSAASARLLFLVSPNGTTDKEDLANARNGDFVDGTAADVSALQANKGADMRVAMEQNNALRESLAFAFLLNSAVQRQGDRVTAEEIRYLAQELEEALGGIYSILTQELQLPLVSLVMNDLERRGKLPKLPKESVRPVVVTGVEALGRGQDLQRLQQFISLVGALPKGAESINWDDVIKRTAASLGIDTKGLVKTPEEVQQEQQQMMIQQAAMQSAPGVASQMAKTMTAQQGAPDAAPQEG